MDSAKRSLFITFEGGEGAGKTTLIDKIEAELIKQGSKVVKTREPGGTTLSEKVRTLLLEKNHNLSIGNTAELLLFLAARAQHIDELIQPSLKAGKFVLCDRFNDSSVAYQGWARGLGFEFVQNLCNTVCGDIRPDLTFFLDLDPVTGLQRAKAVRTVDRIEAEKLGFHHRVREGFHQIAKKNPERLKIIDASQSADKVFRDAWSHIQKII